MRTFQELYEDLLRQKTARSEPLPKEYNPKHLDCLLYPENYAPVITIGNCTSCFEKACQNSCIFDAIGTGEDGGLFIDPSRCSGCAFCIEACESKNLAARKDALAAMKAVREAKEPDIADAVDYVLTFQELQEIFDVAGIFPENLPEEEKAHASKAGRLYARTGGVSQAVREMVHQLVPEDAAEVRCEQANGTKACMEMLERIRKNETDANFFEGMGCTGGCVGGPKAIVDSVHGTQCVDFYAKKSDYQTPLENPYVRMLLEKLGFETVEALLDDGTLLSRQI